MYLSRRETETETERGQVRTVTVGSQGDSDAPFRDENDDALAVVDALQHLLPHIALHLFLQSH